MDVFTFLRVQAALLWRKISFINVGFRLFIAPKTHFILSRGAPWNLWFKVIIIVNIVVSFTFYVNEWSIIQFFDYSIQPSCSVYHLCIRERGNPSKYFNRFVQGEYECVPWIDLSIGLTLGVTMWQNCVVNWALEEDNCREPILWTSSWHASKWYLQLSITCRTIYENRRICYRSSIYHVWG